MSKLNSACCCRSRNAQQVARSRHEQIKKSSTKSIKRTIVTINIILCANSILISVCIVRFVSISLHSITGKKIIRPAVLPSSNKKFALLFWPYTGKSDYGGCASSAGQLRAFSIKIE